MSENLKTLLEQLTPAERSGIVLSVHAPIPRNTHSPKDLRDVIATKIVSEALVRARKQV